MSISAVLILSSKDDISPLINLSAYSNLFLWSSGSMLVRSREYCVIDFNGWSTTAKSFSSWGSYDWIPFYYISFFFSRIFLMCSSISVNTISSYTSEHNGFFDTCPPPWCEWWSLNMCGIWIGGMFGWLKWISIMISNYPQPNSWIS